MIERPCSMINLATGVTTPEINVEDREVELGRLRKLQSLVDVTGLGCEGICRRLVF
jgi:hypothetical protein